MNSDISQNKIAIVGASCRFPGNINNLEDYWHVLANGVDAVTEVPDSRWDKKIFFHKNKKGRSYTFAAGVINDIFKFEPEFFGISKREALQIDPQQRILLELVWEAFENSGIKISKVAKTNCGVFIGASWFDYTLRDSDNLEVLDAYSMLGGTSSICANRISYVFDFQGPSFSVDTACSSSLVALHQACNSIKSGESSMAVVGGINLLMHPLGFGGFSQAKMLSPDGRCKAFDASANGYVRSEGGGIVLLKNLEDAIRDDNQILAVINASSINSDGKTNGLARPGVETQTRLLKNLYTELGVDYNDLDYLEAHGTGTTVGDMVETSAIYEAITSKRNKDNPLVIGSAKTNLGHLEIASGVAGLLKAVLCIQNREIPKSLHFNTPNPDIKFADWNIEVADRLIPIKNSDKKKVLIGINSFGFGGANAHILIEEYKTPQSEIQNTTKLNLEMSPLVITAKTEESLRFLAASYAKLINMNPEKYYDIAYSAYKYRENLELRLGVWANTPEEMVEKLNLYSNSEKSKEIVEQKSLSNQSKIAFIYSGNGSQWLGMGCDLFQHNNVFKQAVLDVDKYWQKLANFSIVEELFNDDADRLRSTQLAQPLLFAIQVAITTVLLDFGLEVDAVCGHSVGEIAASWACGALDLPQAVKIIFERSFIQSLVKKKGKMAVVAIDAKLMQEYLTEWKLTNYIDIAGINAPKSITIAGDADKIESVRVKLRESGFVAKILDVDYAFHSHHMESLKPHIYQNLAEIKPCSTKKASFISTVTGVEIHVGKLNVDYWWSNVREPVDFNRAIDTLITEGCNTFIEIGPSPILTRYIKESLAAKAVNGAVLDTLKRNNKSTYILKNSYLEAKLAARNFELGLFFQSIGKFIQLPYYPWFKEEFIRNLEKLDFIPMVERRTEHPLLGYKMRSTEFCWYNSLDTGTVPWAMDHKVGGVAVLPASAYIEMSLSAAQLSHKRDVIELVDLEIYEPIVLQEDLSKNIVSHLFNDGTFIIKNQEHSTNSVKSRVLPANVSIMSKSGGFTIDDYLASSEVIPASKHYELTKSLGLSYSNTFKTIGKIYLHSSKDKALAIISANFASSSNINEESMLIYPGILDGCFQVLADIIFKMNIFSRPMAMLPISVGRIKFFASNNAVAYCEVQVINVNKNGATAKFKLYDQDYNLLMSLEDARFKSVDLSSKNIKPKTYKFVAKSQVLDICQSNSHFIPSSNVLIKNTIALFKKNGLVKERERYFSEVVPLTNALISSYYFEALQMVFAGKSKIIRQELEKNQKILQFWGVIEEAIKIGKEDGWLGETKNTVRFKQTQMLSSYDIWNTILRDYPEFLPELTLLSSVGQNLAPIIMGNLAAEKISTNRNNATCDHLFNTSQSFLTTNKIASDICCYVQAKSSEIKRSLRILEIGNGHANYTFELISRLKNSACEYVFIDENEDNVTYLQSIAKKFEFFSAIKNNIRDCSDVLPPELKFHSFDIVIINKVLHQVRDLEKTLKYVRRFLLDSGLLLIEELGVNRFNNFVFGLTPNWWYENNQRYFSCLINPDSWALLLKKSGFGDYSGTFEPLEQKGGNSQIILARKSDVEKVCSIAKITDVNYIVITDKSKDCQSLYKKIKEECVKDNISSCEFKLNDNGFALLQDLMIGNTHLVYLAHISLAKPIDISFSKTNERVSEIIQLVKVVANIPNVSLSIITSGGGSIALNNLYNYNPVDAALWGVGRVIMNEYPKLKTRLIDITNNGAISQVVANLLHEITTSTNETEVVLNGDNRFVMRMERFDLEPESIQANYYLDFTHSGSLNNLCWKKIVNLPKLEQDDILVRPIAVGLNFRDVMYAMGMLSDEAVENGFAGATLGMELSGIVEKIGSKKSEFKIGDQVICFASRSFSNKVITKTYATVHKPAKWTFQEAATIPSTFFTVYYALHYLARLEPGEKVLIHGAAGGVGLAAIQYAQYIGAEIFATAGSDEKRDFIRQMGVKHVFDSRSLTFASQISELTQNDGVDVVLNSISGEAIWQNLSILKPFGRFLELGKRDFYENSKIGLRPFRNNISYFGIDADQLLIERKDLAAQLFKELMDIFKAGELHPLPYREFLPNEIGVAFRYMQQSKQIGKIVVNFAENFIPDKIISEESIVQNLVLNSDASYLVTGGTSGFGLKTALWLIDNGAKHIILQSRSGIKAPNDQKLIDDLMGKGINIHIHGSDVGNMIEVNKLFATIKKDYPPLKGVFHAAAYIEDSLLQNLDEQKLEKVMYPKVSGAYNLHLETATLDLDYFVVFSSFATFLGNIGQASYVAANSYLESLVYYRRNMGLNATFAAFGAIADAGFLTRNTKIKDALEAQTGALAIKANDALEQLKNVITANETGAAIVNFDWQKIKKYMPESSSPKYQQQIKQIEDLDEDSDAGSLRDIVLDLPKNEAVAMIIKVLSHDIGSIIHVSPAKLDINKSVFELGMDSLMAVELSMLVEKKFATQIPLMMLSEGATINKLASNILDLMTNNGENEKVGNNDLDLTNAMAAKHGTDLELDSKELVANIQ